MRAAGRRRAKESIVSDRRPPPPTPTTTSNDPWQYISAGGRDSDASFASSRPSSSSIGLNPRSAVPITDRSYQVSALRAINAYLSSQSLALSLKPPLPSAKDITETLKFILSRFGFASSQSQKLEDDLSALLKSLNCPVKLNKSALRAPGTPHSWPSLLAVIHWLVQNCMYDDHLLNSTQTRPNFTNNNMFEYALENYLHFIRGDDDAVDELDEKFMSELGKEKDQLEENVKVLEGNAKELEGKLEALKAGPSQKEALEKEKNVLEEDVKKFHAMIEQLEGHRIAVEKMLEEKKKELEIKSAEKGRICEENEELRKRVEEQRINARDADRIRKELQAVEKNIEENEFARNDSEEKAWDLDSEIGHKFKELEGLMIEGNQAIRRLKLGHGIQYQLNAKGTSAAEVLGIDYKSTLNPLLASFGEEIKKSKMEKLEELITFQQQSVESAAKIEGKRNSIAALQSHIDDVDAQLNLLKKETQDYTSRCAVEARKIVEEVEAEAHNLDEVEREASEFLEVSKAKLQEVILQTKEEVQMCARELFALVDSVSKYKEHMASKIAEMKNDLAKTATDVADTHKGFLSGQLCEALGASH